MQRLIAWIAILAFCASLLLVGVRVLRPAPTSTACVQLLSPTTGDVLTIDAAIGTSLLDARHNFPNPPLTSGPTYRDPLSPDQTHVMIGINQIQSPSTVLKLWLGRRSTTYRRLLTTDSVAGHYVWSPDSRYVAFFEVYGWPSNYASVTLTTVNVDNNHVERETLPNDLDNNWLSSLHELAWSPDSTMVALTMYASGTVSKSTLALHSLTSDQSTFVTLTDQSIAYATWSPNSQVILVFAQGTKWMLYAIERDGHILNQAAFEPDFSPNILPTEMGNKGLQWSPDGQYFIVSGGTPQHPQVDIYGLNGEHRLPTPLEISNIPPVWSAQSHTLLYIAQQAENQTLYALDAATGISTPLMNNLPLLRMAWLAPDATVLAGVTSYAPDYYTPRLIPLTLDADVVPFGTLRSQSYISPNWSPDSQKLMIYTEDTTAFTVYWARKDGSDVHQFQLAKQSGPNELLTATWLTNDIILLDQYVGDDQTSWLLNTRSNTSVELIASSITHSNHYEIMWYDDAYVLVNTYANLIVYRLSDGAALFSVSLSSGYPAQAYVEPHERAVLLYRWMDGSNRNYPTLELITQTSRLKWNSADSLTRPAWSPDGELFAYGAFDSAALEWSLQVISRDGILLKDFPISSPNGNLLYEQARWTNCH